jgi:ribonuclease E
MEIPLAAIDAPAVPVAVSAESLAAAGDEVETKAEPLSADEPAANPMVETAEIPAPPAKAPAEEPLAPSVQPIPPSAEENLVDIDKALEISGLVMVETSSEKSRVWQPEAREETEPLPRRRRPAPAPVSEEPLVMVETRQP